ncbi:MAG TPA: protein kinase [Pyrinomonadaceae bacterium]|jgi:serine/threonine protein kinase
MSDQFIGQTLANKYRIDDALRESGLGRVYRGTHLLMDKPVTVKILSPALAVDENIVKRFSSEARTVSNIAHPNILNVTDFGADKNNAVYIISEGVDGETLKQAVLREGKFPLARAVNIARQIAAALGAAHKKGIIHRHLTSENILLANAGDESELVKVLDFGSINREDESTFEDEAALKDLEYLAPEQISSVSEAEVDERSDIYSLGVILYEMLASEVPFTAENPTALMLKQAEEPPAPLSAFRADLPAQVEPVVLKALAKNPEMRYQTAGEFSEDLLAISDSKAVAAVAAEAPNNIWKTISIVLVGIFALSALLIYVFSTKQTDPNTMQLDANGQPVQPINPATGMNEQSMANMMPYSAEMLANSNVNIAPGGAAVLPGGDGYDPWNRPGAFSQPSNAPLQYVAPGGQVITIDPNNPSQFMPRDDGVVMVPVPIPANTNANVNAQATPRATPKNANTPVNTQPQTTPSNTQQKPAETKPTPAPKTDKSPAKPVEQPKTNKPAATEKQSQSDKKQDT